MADDRKTPEEPAPEASAAATESPPAETPPEVVAESSVEPAEPKVRHPAAGRAVTAAAATVVAMFAVVAGTAAVTAPLWKPAIDSYVRRVAAADPQFGELRDATREIADLRATVARLSDEGTRREQDLAALRGQVQQALAQGAAAPPRPLSAEPALVDELNRRLGRVEATLDADRAAAKETAARATEDQARLSASVQGVKGDLAAVQDALGKRKAADDQSRLLVVALAQLSAALAGPEPFEPLLGSLKAVGGSDPAITQAADAIRPYAGSGIPTLASLRERFVGVARSALQAQAAPEGGSWIDRTVGRLTGLVSVRTVGDQATPRNPVDAALATADRQLKDGNLAAAVDALSKLEGPAAAAMAGWLKDARARLAAQQAIAILNERAISALATAGG